MQVQSKTFKGCTFPDVCQIFTCIEKTVIASYTNDQKVIQGSAIKPINLIFILASARKPLSPPQVKKLKFKCLYKLTVETELGSQLSTICRPNTES